MWLQSDDSAVAPASGSAYRHPVTSLGGLLAGSADATPAVWAAGSSGVLLTTATRRCAKPSRVEATEERRKVRLPTSRAGQQAS